MKEELDNICEECKKEDKSVSQNLIMHGYKICDSCKLSKSIFPVLTAKNTKNKVQKDQVLQPKV